MCGGGTGETSCNCSSLGRICSQTPPEFLPVVQGESKLWCSSGTVCAHCQFLAPSQCLAVTRIDGKRFEKLQICRL